MSKRSNIWRGLIAVAMLLGSAPALAATHTAVDLTLHWSGLLCLLLFVAAYTLVVLEEKLHLRKSIPVMIAAGLIWTVLGLAYALHGPNDIVSEAVRHALLEFSELFFFLLVAMTYVNSLEERGVFDALRAWLVSRGFSLRTIFWITGLLAFFISPLADNMTTALIMSSVALAVGGKYPKFVVVACINIVVAANAGGAWSPFGDITTLMVWQKGKLEVLEFLALFVPALVNWLIPALLMSFAVPKIIPPAQDEDLGMGRGAIVISLMFLATVALTVCLHSFLNLPPVLGMMGGLALLKMYSYYLRKSNPKFQARQRQTGGLIPETGPRSRSLDVFEQIARAEWDTLMFFYGIILCVSGLGLAGYLSLGSAYTYAELGASTANVLVGLASAVIDNIPIMYAVLSMDPAMHDGQWLLVTLTAGVGGSLLSIGSAAGVAVMGQARGVYTFMAHLRWSWAVLLGYIVSIAVHFWINAAMFV